MSLAFASGAHGAVGFFGSYIQVSTNSGSAIWYDLQEPGPSWERASDPENFNGKDFGIFNPSDGHRLTIEGGEGLTYKNNNDNVAGVMLHYGIKKVGVAHDFAGNELGITHTKDATFADAANTEYKKTGDQKWSTHAGWTVQEVLTGLTPGDYQLQVYLSGNYDNPNGSSGTFHSNNDNSNFTATFTVVPEPSSAALLGFGGMALMLRRRR